MVIGRIFKYLGITVVTLAALVAIGYFLGVFGVPQLNGIDNEFGTVNETDTEIRTNVSVNNPNPIGVSIGGVKIDYTVAMNDLPMANGTKNGVSIQTGNSSVEFVTYLNNTRIPEWWYTHIRNGEQTEVGIEATVTHSQLGESPPIEETENVETDILSSFDSTETREINANRELVDDPVLYINETEGGFGDNLTRERTPIDLDFTMYNPKQYPYAVTEIGYTINMNNVTVGEGTTTGEQILAPESTSTLSAETVIQNERLDQWWVSHLENNEETTLTIDSYVVVDPDVPGVNVEPVRIDSDELDYETTIETDILGQDEESSSASASLTAPDAVAVPAT